MKRGLRSEDRLPPGERGSEQKLCGSALDRAEFADRLRFHHIGEFAHLFFEGY